jgi:hypothetical protein
MCNHFCARSLLVRKAELYKLLQNTRASDGLPVIPATRVLVLPRSETSSMAHESTLADMFSQRMFDITSELESSPSEAKVWLLKAGDSSNGNGIHLVTCLQQVASLLKSEHPRGSWCVQEFISDAALVHGCRYSVRLLLLLASSQVHLQIFTFCAFLTLARAASQVQGLARFSAWAFRRPMALRCFLPFAQAQNKRECVCNILLLYLQPI